jgi:hypothetical protein
VTRKMMCPICNTPTDADGRGRTADEFCAKCDFPLFWAPAPVTVASLEDEGAAETTLRRLPGAAGRRAVASIPCPHCHELNPPMVLVCHRCEKPMVVAPEPEPEVEEDLEPVQEEPEMIPIPDERSNVVWWVALAIGLVFVTVLVILLAS